MNNLDLADKKVKARAKAVKFAENTCGWRVADGAKIRYMKFTITYVAVLKQ